MSFRSFFLGRAKNTQMSYPNGKENAESPAFTEVRAVALAFESKQHLAALIRVQAQFSLLVKRQFKTKVISRHYTDLKKFMK